MRQLVGLFHLMNAHTNQFITQDFSLTSTSEIVAVAGKTGTIIINTSTDIGTSSPELSLPSQFKFVDGRIFNAVTDLCISFGMRYYGSMVTRPCRHGDELQKFYLDGGKDETVTIRPFDRPWICLEIQTSSGDILYFKSCEPTNIEHQWEILFYIYFHLLYGITIFDGGSLTRLCNCFTTPSLLLLLLLFPE